MFAHVHMHMFTVGDNKVFHDDAERRRRMRIDERANVTTRVTIRRLATGDEALLATLATYRALSDDEARAFLGDEDTILLVAFDEAEPAVAHGIGRGFVLTDRDNIAAMGLYRTVGGRDKGDDVLWEFDYRAP